MSEESDPSVLPTQTYLQPNNPQFHDKELEDINRWECPMCTFINSDKNRYCEACSYRYRSTKRKSTSSNVISSKSNAKTNSHDFALHLQISTSNNMELDWKLANTSKFSISGDSVMFGHIEHESTEDNTSIMIDPQLNKGPEILTENEIPIEISGNISISMDNVTQSGELEVKLESTSDQVLSSATEVTTAMRSPNVKKTPSKNNRLTPSANSTWDCPFCTYKNRNKDKFCSVCGYEKNHDPQQLNRVIQEQAERAQASRIYSAELESINLNKMLNKRLFFGESLDDSEAITTGSLDETSFDDGSSTASIGMTQKAREYFEYVPPLRRGMTISWTCKECEKEYNLKDPHCPNCLSLQRPPFYYLPLCVFHKSVEKRQINQEFFEAAMLIDDGEEEELTASALVAAANASANASAKLAMDGGNSVELVENGSVDQDADVLTIQEVVVNTTLPTPDCWYPYRPPRIGADFQVDLLSFPSHEDFSNDHSADLLDSDNTTDSSKWQKDNEYYEILWISPPSDLSIINNDDTSVVSDAVDETSSKLATDYSEYFEKFSKSPVLAMHVLYKENYDIVNAVNALSLETVESPSEESSTSVEFLHPIMQRRTPRGQMGLDMPVVEMNDDDRNKFRIALIRYGGDNWNKIAKQLSYKYTLGQLQDYFYCIWMNRYKLEYLETERQHRTFIRINAAKKKRKAKFLTKQQFTISSSESMTSVADIPSS